jgi:monomeric sarcosine oxidase
MPVDVDVAVVGAGLAGAASAWAASKRGLSVVLLEQFAIGHHRGSSHGSARIFRRAYADELYVRLTGESAELWRELELDTGASLVRTTGGVDHGANRDVEVIDEYLTTAGVPHEMLDPLEAGRQWPGMRFSGPVLFHPGAGVLDAAGTVVACVEASRRRGALVRQETTVTDILLETDRAIVVAGEQAWSARRAVIAAGAWVADLLQSRVPFPPVAVTQQPVFHFPCGDPSVDWPVFVHQDERFTYGLPGGRDGGEHNAQKVAEHDLGQVTTASGRDGVVDVLARRRVVEYVKEWLPGLVPEPYNESTCLYTTTADEDFVLDRYGPLVICSACSGHGAKFAPWLGAEVVKLVTGAGVAQERFRLRRPGLVAGKWRQGLGRG